MLEEIEHLVSGGLTSEELTIAKQGILEGFQRNLSNDAAVLGLLHDGLYLERKMDYWAKRNAAIGALGLEQVNATLKRHLRPETLIKITCGDKKKM
jgi:zinc protease